MSCVQVNHTDEHWLRNQRREAGSGAVVLAIQFLLTAISRTISAVDGRAPRGLLPQFLVRDSD